MNGVASNFAGLVIPEPDVFRLSGDLEALADHRDPAEPGWSRILFSDAYSAGRRFVADLMSDAGLFVSQDDAGNIIGRLSGSGATGAIVTGSHTDTVRGGGRYDGTVGVIGAIEAVRVLRTAGVQLQHDLCVVDFLGEEPNPWGVSCLGSRALAGTLDSSMLEARDQSGKSLAQAMTDSGINPDSIKGASWKPGDVHAFLELHIEQGPVLERMGVQIGVVTGIVGIVRFVARFRGQSNHAGTTPMPDRHDALCAAAEVIMLVEQLARCGNGVATVGRVLVEPGSINVVPGQTNLWVEVRSISTQWMEETLQAVEDGARTASARRGVSVEFDGISFEPPTPVPNKIRGMLNAVAEEIGVRAIEIPSGAEHDARQLAQIAPIGMIFVPSRGGLSHCAEEWSDPNQISVGVHVLTCALVALDGIDRSSLNEGVFV